MTDQEGAVSPLVAPVKMLADGFGIIFGSMNSVAQSAVNMGATNVQDFSQTMQRGHAQFVSGLNQINTNFEGIAKKPLVDIQQISQGGAPQVPSSDTLFSPPGGADENYSPAQAEQYHPMTEDQSDFMYGGFTEAPQRTDEPSQASQRETLFL